MRQQTQIPSVIVDRSSQVDGPCAAGSELPTVLVLGLADTGYGIVRCFAGTGVPVVAFERNAQRPEVRTRLCDVVHFDDDQDLLDRLLGICDRLPRKPVLYLGGDALVKFYCDHQQLLSQRVRIEFPRPDAVATLLDKTRFTAFAEEHGLAIPKTVVVRSVNDLDRVCSELRFPVVLKPSWRDARWKAARFPKVFVFEDQKQLTGQLPGIMSVVSDLVAQEWIPGGDDAIFFCLAYFDARGECLAKFVGRKLRQWPVGTGSTACAEPVHEPSVAEETLRLFRTIGFAGFGSVEFKRHAANGRFYIMEPTVGRANHQSYIACANGVNLPCLAYESLTGTRLPAGPGATPGPTVWIDDQFDALSILVSLFRGTLNWSNLWRSYTSRKSFRFLNPDIRPLLCVYWQAPGKLAAYVWRSLRRGTPQKAAG